MAEKDGGRVKGRLQFEDLGDGEAPALALARVDARGERHPVEVEKDGTVVLEPAPADSRSELEVRGAPGTEVRRYHYDEMVSHLRAHGTYMFPKAVWQEWFLHWRCVSGTVESCFPRYLLDAVEQPVAALLSRAGLGVAKDLHAEATIGEHLHLPRSCRPVCDGTVDIYLQTCCCPWIDPDTVLRKICEIIDCDRLVWPPKPRDPGDPPFELPGPLHGPGPAPDVARSEALAATLRRAVAGDPTLPGPSQVLDLYAHHIALGGLDARAQVAYIKAYPELRFLGCHCSLTKVASTPIHEDGAFEACFPVTLNRLGCTQRVVYVVTQATTSGPQVVYDGRVGPRTFDLGEQALLQVSWRARTCGRDDTLGEGVFLNRIGGTSAVALVRSVDQSGELSFAALAATDGLVNGGANVWGGTLALRYTFNPALQGLGATYYRIRTQRVGDDGQPIGAPSPHVTPVAWGQIQGLHIVSKALGPNPVGAPAGLDLYTIPYYADGWDFDANSFHAFVDTSSFVSNGRYLLVIDVFDNAGQRLVPDELGPSVGNDHGTDFRFLRQVPGAVPGVTDLVDVPQRALANLVKVDNTPADAHFVGLVQTGSQLADVGTGCQFLTGAPGDHVQLKYEAHQAAGWLAAVDMTVTEGIGGTQTTLLAGSPFDTGPLPSFTLTPLSVPNPSGGPPALVPSTIGQLLGADAKCSFAATMAVSTRHTDGSGPLYGLWAHDVAAFALEQS